MSNSRLPGLKLAGAYIPDAMYQGLVKLAQANNRTLAGQCRAIYDQALANPKEPALKPQQETITWIADGALPGSPDTVLISAGNLGVGEGFYDGEVWRWASAGRIPGKVTAWSNLPEGVK